MIQVLINWLSNLNKGNDAENRKTILSFLNHNPSAKLLDIGFGDGIFTTQLAKRIGTEQVYGIEIVDSFVDHASTKDIKAYFADLNQPWPVESDSFDVVHANQVFEHIYNTDVFLKEIYRILVGGDSYYLYTKFGRMA